ncbi:MAG: SdiA-regulated domain-containing protein [Gemmatimonadaceae bacterium]
MRKEFVGTIASVIAISIVGCSGVGTHTNEASIAKRESVFAAHLKAATVSTSDPMVARWILPSWLSEISGLTLLRDGRMLVHADESARISVIDVKRGEVTKKFVLGRGSVAEDFEGITTVGDTIYLLSSKGILFLFHEGDNDAGVPYRTFDTRLGKECEFEGVVYDSATSSLYLPCKRVLKKKEKKHEAGSLLVFRLPLPLGSTDDVARIELPLAQNDSSRKEPTFQASDITRDPATGHLVALASRERQLIEFTTDGEVVREELLPSSGHHQQPEGIAITRDGLLIVSDEAVRTPAAITVYRWPLAPMAVVQ